MTAKVKASNPAAQELGRLGGLATKGKTSKRKAEASRRNGRLGGRPRKRKEKKSPVSVDSHSKRPLVFGLGDPRPGFLYWSQAVDPEKPCPTLKLFRLSKPKVPK